MELTHKEAQLVGADGRKTDGVRDEDLASSAFEKQAQCETHSVTSEGGKREGALDEDGAPSALNQGPDHLSNDDDKSDIDGRIGQSENSDTSISSKSSAHNDDTHGQVVQQEEGHDMNDDGVLVHDGNDDTILSENSWEGETPPLDLNYEALKHIVSVVLSHDTCIDITTLHRGSFHEIRVLHFEDSWSCIARFTRDYEMLCKTESELATMEFVRKHTTIPVPRVYFVNHNENHVVGAPFVLMERLEGDRLCDVWTELTLEHKLAVIHQLANVHAQLAELKFGAIGSLDSNGTLGPLISITQEWDAMGDEAFTSTLDCFFAFLRDDDVCRTAAARECYPAIRDELRSFLEKEASNPTLKAPYRLIHGDLASQNILVLKGDPTQSIKISGIIDWDYSHTGPLYYLCEYPHDILDWFDFPERHVDNKVLRKHFVTSLIEHFPEGSVERKQVKQCFREKSYILNAFHNLFIRRSWPESVEESLVRGFLRHVRGESEKWMRLPYDGGSFDWEPDSDLEDSDFEGVETDSKSADESECSSDSDQVGSSDESSLEIDEDSSSER
jgi:fructosamine-3-kinase